MPHEVHITGVLVHARPAALARVRSHLGQIDKARIHADPGDGRLVLTLETDGARRTVDYLDAIRMLPGVTSVSMVYQHAEPEEAMDELIDCGQAATLTGNLNEHEVQACN